MAPAAGSDVTGLLRAWRDGGRESLDRLMPILEQELRRMAARCMRRERANHTLQATALVNEAYLRLADVERVHWRDRVHFFAVAARMMRRVLVDHARSRGYAKRGGGVAALRFDDALAVPPDRDANLIELDDALCELERHDSRKAKVVELRFFAGLSVEETAVALEVSPQTVLRDWSFAKCWLMREMRAGGHG
jgi:RNA polymerase sigma factor (TIGR02999 family)